MWLHRALLYLYPKPFRYEYGGQMAAIFEEGWRRASSVGRVLMCLAAVPEIAAGAAAIHWDLTLQDLRSAMRSLRRSPGFAATAAVIIALGIGANTAVFTIADWVLIRPLPFRDPGRLVRVMERTPGYSFVELSPGNYRDWKSMNTVSEGMGTYTTRSANLFDAGVPERLETAAISADLLPVLGVEPVIGRAFSRKDDLPGAPGTLLLSYSFWQAHFGGNPAVLGRQLALDSQPYTAIGVMPPDFHFPSGNIAVWTTQRFDEEDYRDRTDNYINAVARLRPEVSIEQARADFVRVAAILEKQFPRENKETSATVMPLRGDLSPQSRFLLFALCGAAFCVLLIACANLANLLIVRSLARRKELAVRTAMGAGRERLIRQLATESLMLAAAGGALGVCAAAAGVPLLSRLVPVTLPIAHPPSVDLRVLGFALVLTLAVGLAFGLLPVFRTSATVDLAGLGDGQRAVGGSQGRVRRALVAAEVAASVVLLVSTGLLLRALMNVQAIDPGFRTSGILTLRTDLPRPRYDATAARVSFYDRVLRDVRALPGVSSAAYIGGLPIVRRAGVWPVEMSGMETVPSAGDTASVRFVTPDYFKTLGIPLRRGRDILESDTLDRNAVAVVSASFARRYWPNRDPVGRTFRIALAERTVVGVAGDVHVRGLERASEPQVYLAYKQVPDGWLVGYFPDDLVIRTAGDDVALLSAVRTIVRNIDPLQPISDVQTIEQILSSDTASRDAQLRVLGIFAAIAFLLAGVGIHGLLSCAVSLRTPEIGVRMALGADPRAILVMVAREGAVLVLIGAAAGCGLAYAAARAMQALLAGVAPADTLTYAAAAGSSMMLALCGSVIPVFRAVRVDPVTAIKQ